MEGKYTHDSIIGITGGIGAGKSVISRLLRCNGCYVYDCDFEAKKIMEKDPEVKESLVMELGKEIYLDHGGLNRPKLAALIFNDEAARIFVNGIVHKAVITDILNKRKKINGLFFVESAILASSGISLMCGFIWLVSAPLEERIKRVISRDKTDEDSILKRIESQELEISLLDKKKTIEIINDNYHPLLIEILNRVNKLNQEYKISC